ncbi:MAG: T9SS type A sorting domain-containing protein, partial [Bacteroidales bacterium]|jgi:hypothetical protein|nr:T9SS type A sorting domain-containing protein [Bacteroidales bacterium]
VFDRYVGETINLKYEKYLRQNNAWSKDLENLKKYPIYLFKDGVEIDTIAANTAFVQAEYFKNYALSNAGEIEFSAKAVTAGSERSAEQIHTITMHNPVVTLTASGDSSVVEGEQITITANVPFAHDSVITVVITVNDNADFVESTRTITIAAKQASGSLTLTATNDHLKQPRNPATIGIASVTGISGITFVTTSTVEITIIDADENCPGPATPQVNAIQVYDNSTEARFTVNTSYGMPVFTLWTATTAGTQRPLEFRNNAYYFELPQPLSVGTLTFYLQVVDTSLTAGCQVGATRGTITVTVNEGSDPSNLDAVSISITDIAVLGDSLVIRIDPSKLSANLDLTAGENLYFHPFYKYKQNPGDANDQELVPANWLAKTYPMTYANGIYTFTIPNIRNFFGLTDANAWRGDRPTGMGFLFYNEDASVEIKTTTTAGYGVGDFWLGLRQDYAVSLWIADGRNSYYSGETTPLKFEKQLQYNSLWTKDFTSQKNYPIYLYMDGTRTSVEVAPIATFTEANGHTINHSLPTVGEFVFSAKAVTAGSERVSTDPWTANNPTLSQTITVLNPIVTLSRKGNFNMSANENNVDTIIVSIPIPATENIVVPLIISAGNNQNYYTLIDSISIVAGATNGKQAITIAPRGSSGLRDNIGISIGTITTKPANVNFVGQGTLSIPITADPPTECEQTPTPTIAELPIQASYAATSATFTISNYDATFIYRVYRYIQPARNKQMLVEFAAGTGATKLLSGLDPIFSNSNWFYLEAVDLTRDLDCQNSEGTIFNINVKDAPALLSLAPADEAVFDVGEKITFTAKGNATTSKIILLIMVPEVGAVERTVNSDTLSFEWTPQYVGEHTVYFEAFNDANYMALEIRTFSVRDTTVPPTTHVVSITQTTGGTVVVKNGSTIINHGDAVEHGTMLTLVATAAQGYEFTRWTHDNHTVANHSHMLIDHITISAVFTQISSILNPTDETVLMVYPNPVTNGQLTIDNGKLPIDNVEIYDIMGKKQLSIINYQLSIIQINISHLPSGIYFVKVGNNVVRVVKQ